MVEAAPYDEVYDRNRHRRPAYTLLERQLGWDPLCPPIEVADRLRRRPLGDDHSVLPIPLALTGADHRVLETGVAQRALALQMFYVDTFLADQQFIRSGTSLTSRLLDEMLAAIDTSVEYFRHWWSGHDAAEVRFVYGPDLVRGQDGRWVVLEDNVGCVGGCADTHYVTEAYRHATGSVLAERNPDMGRAVLGWLDALGLAPSKDGVIAVLTDGDTLDGYLPARFDEAGRRAQLVENIGVKVLDDQEFGDVCRRAAAGAAELEAIVNLGVTSPETWPLLRDIAFGQRHTPMMNAPGTIVLGHKALLPFMDQMIRFYCREEPILVSPPTLLLRDGTMPNDLHNWVVKTGTGCRADGVFVLRWQKPEQMDLVRAMLSGSWSAQTPVAQRYVEPSRIALEGGTRQTYRVEVRALAYITGWQQVVVSEQSVGKLVADQTPGLLNDLFQKASYAAIIRSDV